MKIDTTLGAFVDAEQALGRVLAIKFDKDGGAKVRYHVTKLARLVSLETKHFYDERNTLVEKYGEGEPKTLSSTSTNWAAFMFELKALSEVSVTIAWGPVTEAMVEPYADITAADLIGLGPLYDDA